MLGPVRSTASDLKVVLHNVHNGSLVLYNDELATLTVFRGQTAVPPSHPKRQCPLCHSFVYVSTHEAAPDTDQDPFMRADYFQLLSSLPYKSDTNTNDTDTSSSKRKVPGASESKSEGLRSSSFNNGYYAAFFTEEARIGHGGYGSVYRVQHVLDGVPLGTYAVKKIPVGDSKAWLVHVLREVKALERLHHPNVIDYKHTWIEQDKPAHFGPEVPCLFVLMQYANRGTVADLLWPKQSAEGKNNSPKQRRRRKSVSAAATAPPVFGEVEIFAVLSGIASGLRYLHRQGIVHRDIKPENILLTQISDAELGITPEEAAVLPSWRRLRVLISDFGESRVVGAPYQHTGNTGTRLFTAPEILSFNKSAVSASDHDKNKKKKHAEDENDENENDSPSTRYWQRYPARQMANFEDETKCDMWGLGCIAYAFAFGKLPYEGATPDAVLNAILTKPLIPFPTSPIRSQPFLLLIQGLLHPDPQARSSWEDVFAVLDTIPLAIPRASPAPLAGLTPRRRLLKSPLKPGKLPVLTLDSTDGGSREDEEENDFAKELKIVTNEEEDPAEMIHNVIATRALSSPISSLFTPGTNALPLKAVSSSAPRTSATASPLKQLTLTARAAPLLLTDKTTTASSAVATTEPLTALSTLTSAAKTPQQVSSSMATASSTTTKPADISSSAMTVSLPLRVVGEMGVHAFVLLMRLAAPIMLCHTPNAGHILVTVFVGLAIVVLTPLSQRYTLLLRHLLLIILAAHDMLIGSLSICVDDETTLTSNTFILWHVLCTILQLGAVYLLSNNTSANKQQRGRRRIKKKTS